MIKLISIRQQVKIVKSMGIMIEGNSLKIGWKGCWKEIKMRKGMWMGLWWMGIRLLWQRGVLVGIILVVV